MTSKLRILTQISTALVAVAATTVSVASAWIFPYQPKTPKCLMEKSH